jgi:hypothetical protein
MYNYDHKIQYNNISEPLKNETYNQDILTCFEIKGFEMNETNYISFTTDRKNIIYTAVYQSKDLFSHTFLHVFHTRDIPLRDI